MFDPKALLPILRNSMPKATDAQILEALTKLAHAHPQLNGMQALAAIQKYMQERTQPTIGMMARKGAVR